MRKSVKEQQVEYHTHEIFAFKARECSACHSLCRWDFMYEVAVIPNTPPSAFFCKYCMKTPEEAYEAVFTHEITANEIALNNDVRFLQMQLRKEERKIQGVKESFDDLIKLAMNVPDGEMTPFVMSTVVLVENSLRKL